MERVSRYLGLTQRNGNGLKVLKGPTGRRKAASYQGSVGSPGNGGILGRGEPLNTGCYRAAIETGKVIMDDRKITE